MKESKPLKKPIQPYRIIETELDGLTRGYMMRRELDEWRRPGAHEVSDEESAAWFAEEELKNRLKMAIPPLPRRRPLWRGWIAERIRRWRRA